ncbi:hypothetical protein ACGF2Y_31370, partial [Streptomyces sp. NPDC048142]
LELRRERAARAARLLLPHALHDGHPPGAEPLISNVRQSGSSSLLSRLRVEPVSQEDSLTAVALLRNAGGLHGHKYAIDALVAALALRVPAPVIVLTSDRDDWSKLCGKRVIIKEV